MPPGRTLSTLLLLLLLTGCTAPRPPTSPAPPTPASHIPTPLSTSTPVPPPPFLRVLNYAIALERDAWEQFDYGNFHGDFLTSPEARALFAYLQADLTRDYPDGYPRAGHLFTDHLLDPNLWFPPQAIWTLAQAGVVELLRAAGSSLQPKTPLLLPTPVNEPAEGQAEGEEDAPPLFTLLPTPLQLDADPDPEWLLEITSIPYNLHGWLPLDEQNGQYTLLPNDLRHENRPRAQALNAQITPDLNSDGLHDFITYLDGQLLGSQFGTLQVYGTLAGGLYLLDTFQLKPGETFEIVGNQLHLHLPRSLNFDCTWTQTNTYHWQGETDYYTLNPAPPDTPLCQAALALSPLANLPPETRITLLEHALATLPPDTLPSEDYLTLLSIHLAMAYAGLGLDEQAAQTIQTAIAQTTPFAEQLRPLWETSAHNPILLCQHLYQAANTFTNTELARYFTPVALFTAYGDALPSSAPLLCPLKTLLKNRLITANIPVAQPFSMALPGLEDTFDTFTPANLDADPEQEWYGVLLPELAPLLVIADAHELWTFFTFPLPGPTTGTQFRAALSQENHPALFYLAVLDETTPVSAYPACWARQASFVSELGMIAPTEKGFEVSKTTILCNDDQALDLPHATLLALFPQPEPDTLPTPDNPRAFYRFLEGQEAQLFTAANLPEIRTTLEALLATISPDHPAAEHLTPRLRYAIALSYALEGDTNTARSAYLELITAWPNSPWAWLAQERLEAATHLP